MKNKILIIFTVIIVALCIAVIVLLRSAANKRIDNAPTHSRTTVSEIQQ